MFAPSISRQFRGVTFVSRKQFLHSDNNNYNNLSSCLDAVENIDFHEEYRDQQGHPARHHVGPDNERDPREHDEQATWQVDCYDGL